ncbi:hypothetical protein B566_EDAN002087 [Ephemera danica]|nr:hypothetical protein B566_EDAN002087 [Ephemera danica]
MHLIKICLIFDSCGPVPGVGKARLLLGLPGEFNAVAVTGLGSQGRGHNELEELHEGLEDATAEGATLASWQYQGPGLRAAKKRAPPQLILHGSVEVKIHDREWAEKLKMGSFLSVTRGTAEPPRFLEILYRGTDSKQAPVALVVTFDSGGISLKPSSKMDAMRADMGGAACVVATILATAQLKLPININATKPGDVVTAMNGKTITVDNTDAEGRLILADALCLAAQANPRHTVDIATLTAGAFTNCSQTWDQLRRAGAITGDRAWRFPLWSYYTRQISGSGADVNNVGKPGGGGGSCTAAAFLKEFAGPGPWLHLDIASVMSADGKEPGYLPRGMAGRPVRGLVQLLSQLTL